MHTFTVGNVGRDSHNKMPYGGRLVRLLANRSCVAHDFVRAPCEAPLADQASAAPSSTSGLRVS